MVMFSLSIIFLAIATPVKGKFLQMTPVEIDLSRVIKNITGLRITACYMECANDKRCDSFGITEQFDDHLHICHLLQKSNSLAEEEEEKKTILQGTGFIKMPSPINGGFSAWKNSTSCSETCGVGNMTYTRSCDNPKPQHGGADCRGEKMKTEPCLIRYCQVCYGAKDNDFGEFVVWKTGQLKAIRLTHISGSLYCTPREYGYGGRWGCSYYNDRALLVVITNEENHYLFPESIGSEHYYEVKGATINGDQLILLRKHVIKIHDGEKLRIWDYEDLEKYHEYNNSGKHCVFIQLIYDE